MKKINLRRAVKRGNPTLLDKYIASVLRESKSMKLCATHGGYSAQYLSCPKCTYHGDWIEEKATFLCAYIEYASPQQKLARLKEALREAIAMGATISMTTPGESRIDFEKEFNGLPTFQNGLENPTEIVKWARSIAERVEESTIKRCEAEWDILKDEPQVKRLYSNAQDDKKGI